jgi:hypothetical protein
VVSYPFSQRIDPKRATVMIYQIEEKPKKSFFEKGA